MISVRVLRDLADDQLEDATQMLIRAFEGQTVTDMLTESKRSIQEKWNRAGLRATALEGRIWAVFDDSHDHSGQQGDVGNQTIVSLAAAFGPGTTIMGSEAQRSLGLYDYLHSLTPETLKWMNETHDPLRKKCLEHDLTGPLIITPSKVVDSWLVAIVATDPAHRKRGYATAILEAIKQQAKEDETCVLLATWKDELELFYQGLGLAVPVGGRVTIPSPLGDWVHRVMVSEDQIRKE
ncbi:hypothetical protein MD484_g8723, partial [Candolleomyces efflorescens]